MSKTQCPVCSFLTFDANEFPGSLKVCPVCSWNDDQLQCENPLEEEGTNSMSLKQAKENYKMFKACHIEYVQKCRAPTAEEIPSSLSMQSGSLLEASSNSSCDEFSRSADHQEKLNRYGHFLSHVRESHEHYESSEEENETEETRARRRAKCADDGVTSNEEDLDFDHFQSYQPLGDVPDTIGEENGDVVGESVDYDAKPIDAGVSVENSNSTDQRNANHPDSNSSEEQEVFVAPIVPPVPTIPPLSSGDIDVIRNTMAKLKFKGRFALDAVVDQILVQKPRVGDETVSE